MSSHRLIGLCLTLLAALAAAPAATTGPAPSRHDRIAGLAAFHAAAKQHFAWFDHVPDLDWDRTFRDFLPLVEPDQSTLDYYRTLQRFAALLGDGHTQVYLPQDLENSLDRLPLVIDEVEGHHAVVSRTPTPEILASDIPPGTLVLSIDGLPTADYFAQKLLPYVAAGNTAARRHTAARLRHLPTGAELRVELRRPDGATETRTLRASHRSVRWTDDLRARYLPPGAHGPPFSARTLDDGTLYVRYAACTGAAQTAFAELIDSLDPSHPPPAMILDLRHNGGGSTPSRAARHLIAKPVPWFTFRSRLSLSYFEAQTAGQSELARTLWLRSRGMSDKVSPGWLDFTSKDPLQPASRHYDGPLLILTDTPTASAAEDFIALLRSRPHTTLVGRPTFGSTGQPLFLDLPAGGRARICTTQCRLPDGTDFVGPGFQPDVPVPRTLRSVRDNTDDILDAAIAHLRKSRRD